MVVPRSRLAAIVLAAGAGSRFSDVPGGKLLTEIDGQPLLGHVLSAVRRFGPGRTTVVLGFGAEAIERSIDWHGEQRVVNPEPGRGLASSIQAGFEVLRSGEPRIDGAFIVLGDQPRLGGQVLAALAAAAQAGASARPIVVPRYPVHPGPRNPVLLMRPAWSLVDSLSGDQGLGAIIDAERELVREVRVEGSMPDVDRPEDLARLDEAPT